jgi:transcriptional regulator with XRE-family HTH domain
MIAAMTGENQRRLLGDFVRAHRERLHAEAVAGRRRTPGLRREELAARAGISVTWCTFIEQGRDVRASPHALSRLAQALSLTRAERAYLFELADRRDPVLPQSGDELDAPLALVDAVSAVAGPAYGLDPLWTACCWNKAAARLFVGWLDANCDRNLLRFVFLDPAARRLIPDWDNRARRVLAELRADYSRRLSDPRLRALLEELRAASDFFARCWDAQEVLQREGGLRRFEHPIDGRRAFTQHTFIPAERSDYKLIVLTPTDDLKD